MLEGLAEVSRCYSFIVMVGLVVIVAAVLVAIAAQ